MSSLRSTRCATVLVLALLFASAPARWGHAQSAAPTNGAGDAVVAAETFRAGEAAYARGDFKVAARSFAAAHRLAPHPHAAYNAGLAWQSAGLVERAADAFADSIRQPGLGDAQLQEAKKRLGALRGKLGRLVVTAPNGTMVRVGEGERRAPPFETHLSPGRHQLRAEIPGGEIDERDVAVVANTVVTVDLTPTRMGPTAESTASLETNSAGGDRTQHAHIVGGITALGLGVAMGAVSIGTGVAALEARDTFNASANTDAEAHDRAATLRTVTNVGWAVTGALAVTGTIVLLTMPSANAELGVAPSGASFRVRF